MFEQTLALLHYHCFTCFRNT